LIAAAVVAVVALLIIFAVVLSFMRAIAAIERQHQSERDSWRLEHATLRAEHRAEVRELLNRYQFPSIMPQTRTQVASAPDPHASLRDQQRRAWLGVGRSAPVATAPVDPGMNGAIDDELGDDVP
jgi:uncharacterized membrane protein YhiD involved in acid resistance